MRRLDALTFKQLRALEAVARTGSITLAAADLGVTAPAVHSQPKTLDDNFVFFILTLFFSVIFRSTAEGQALLGAFHKASVSLELAIHRIDALHRGFAGTVVLGVVSTGKYFAPSLVARLREVYPDIEVVLRIGNRDSIIAALQDSAIDLAIMGRPPRDPPVVAHEIGDHPHVLVAPPGHRLAGVGHVDPDDILSETIIVREPGSGTRILATRFLDRLGEGRPYETVEMGSNETIKQAVIAGLGIALISLHTVTEELKTGRLVTVAAAGLPIIRHWFVLHRADLEMTGAIARVRDFVEAKAGGILPKVG